MAKKITRAADLIRRRNKPPTVKEILSGNITSKTRRVGSANGRQYGEVLRAAIAAGDVPQIDYSKPYKSAKDAKRQQDIMQARSQGFLEAIRKRLTGDVLGSPNITSEDYQQLEMLDQLAEALKLKDSKLARRRADIQAKLQGQLGLIRKALLATGDKALGAAQGIADLTKSIIGRLTGDTLKNKLAGFGLLPKGDIPTDEVTLPDSMRSTPTQGQKMVGVSSSNVKSIGWEPHDQQANVTDNNLGTLYIEFMNGWRYKYRDAPHWLYEALLRAPSKGKAVWALIRRGLYPDGVPYGSVNREGYERIR